MAKLRYRLYKNPLTSAHEVSAVGIETLKPSKGNWGHVVIVAIDHWQASNCLHSMYPNRDLAQWPGVSAANPMGVDYNPPELYYTGWLIDPGQQYVGNPYPADPQVATEVMHLLLQTAVDGTAPEAVQAIIDLISP